MSNNYGKVNTFGAEIEKTVTNSKTGLPHKTSETFFQKLKRDAQKRKTFLSLHTSDLKPDIVLGTVSQDLGEQGIDNGFNLLETSTPYKQSLHELNRVLATDLSLTQKYLQQENASVINLSIHPLGKRDYNSYLHFVAPKGVYPYIWYRGWDHTAGIDAKSQNCPTTGVNPYEAADALSIILGAGAAFIGLFANSPYEEGKRSSFKESRLTMWKRMMQHSKIKGDRITSQFPPERFHTLAQYFNWMFGKGTGIHFVMGENSTNHDYKGIGDGILLIQGTPSLLEYLSCDSWQAFFLKDLQNDFPPQKAITVRSNISHMETMQFAQFTGARIRYGFKNHDAFPIQEFLQACKNPSSQKVEEIFSKYTQFMYIEGRDPGANFPDREIWDKDSEVANSVVISPSALQAGLIQNASEAIKFINSFKWQQLGALREAAIKDGLAGVVKGISVYEFTKKILEIAAKGLNNNEQKMLNYPEFVLKTKKNNADRAIEFVEKRKGSLEKRLRELILYRSVITSDNLHHVRSF